MTRLDGRLKLIVTVLAASRCSFNELWLEDPEKSRVESSAVSKVR